MMPRAHACRPGPGARARRRREILAGLAFVLMLGAILHGFVRLIQERHRARSPYSDRYYLEAQ